MLSTNYVTMHGTKYCALETIGVIYFAMTISDKDPLSAINDSPRLLISLLSV